MTVGEISPHVVTAIRCQDMQTGLQSYSVNNYDVLIRTGMAARLAIHIRGGDVIPYTALKELSSYLFGIPSIAFDTILEILADVEFITLLTQGNTIISVIPQVPYFNDMYELLGQKAESEGLNELEQASIEIINRLSESPVKREHLRKSISLGQTDFDTIISIGNAGSLISSVPRPFGDDLLLSPLYFGENAGVFINAVSEHGEATVRNVMEILRQYPGLPYELAKKRRTFLGQPLAEDELATLSALVQRGVTQPPYIATTYSGKNHFLFTPPVGTEQIRVVEKEIYEKAMAVVATLRQGQHFGNYRIKWPVAVINALLDPARGKLRPTTLAKQQWAGLAMRKVCRIEHVGNSFYEVSLIDLPENRRALEVAREMLVWPEVVEQRGFDKNAHKLIQSGGEYRESLIGYGDIRKLQDIPNYDKGIAQNLDHILDLLQKG